MPITTVLWTYDETVTPSPEVRAAHLDYLGALLADGALLAAGPRSDVRGGVLVFACSVDDVPDLLAADPFSTVPLIRDTQIVPWDVAVGALVPAHAAG